jgi:hypothetical protein
MTSAASASRERAREIPGMMATLASYQGLFGPYHPQTLAMTTVLGVALCASGSRVEGRRLLERAVEDLTRHHGRNHPARIRALEAWAGYLCQEQDWEAALPVQRELLDRRTESLGWDHPDSLAARDQLAATLSARMDAARSLSA